jgi:2-polyprenyl-3-methyl-5-hydroxy-6-metoxy-1,4-benzoquinol methylase
MRQVAVSCVVCGSGQDREFRKVGQYRLAQCTACGLLYINPRPDSQSLNELYATNDKYFRENYEPLSRELPVLRRVLRDIRRFLQRGSVLEVGCGRGELLALARRDGFQVQGCDPQRSPTADSSLPIFVGPLASGRFADESFDCVVMRGVLEHLFDPAREVRICHRLLKPGGLMYIKVPNGDYHYGWRWWLVLKSHQFEPPWHLNYFSQSTLNRFLLRAGFSVTSWLNELPTTHPSRLRNAIQQAGFSLFEGARLLTVGEWFPKPLLTCMARKLPRNRANC